MSLDWYDAVPKVELHLHLEGAIPLDALWTLVSKYGDRDVRDRASLARRFEYRSFRDFLDVWTWQISFLREYEDFEFAAEAVARDLARQNVRYVEAFYSPSDFLSGGMEVQGITTAIRRGLSRVPGVAVALIADFVRDYGPDRASRTLVEILEVRDQGVIGVGIGGSEYAYPPEPFRACYERARCEGLRTTAHAGEAEGPASIWGVLRALEVDRLGHATRAEEDPALVDFLVAQRIPLEMCPLSNVRTGVLPSLEGHPIRRLFDRGALVTVNTDDPTMFGTSLAVEYRALERSHGFTHDDIRTLILNAVEASWLPSEGRRQLRAELCSSPDWLDPTPDAPL